jgi:hypothetical protein
MAVTVVVGVNDAKSEAFVGKTVAQVRAMNEQALRIDSEAVAQVNGEAVNGSYVLRDGQTLEFCKASGRKGL